jgi:RNA polymerase sigma factor (TIGR02999 family)
MEQQGLSPDPAARQAYQQRFAELYEVLQRIARRELGHTPRTSLDTTVLVHEAYLKLHRQPLDVSQRGPFLALAAKAMRHVLVDHIRARQAEKRGGDLVRVTLHTGLPGDTTGQVDLLALERGLQALETLDPRLAIVVECRFYGGLEFQEIAAHLGLTPRTVNRDWRKARAFLLTHLEASA